MTKKFMLFSTMKENQNISIVGSKIILVPYRAYHVPKYHEWMRDSDIRKLTASEPLSLIEEYEMQEKWAEDEDKCTFIVLEKQDHYENFLDNMVGDVNLFFELNPDNGSRTSNAELEVMIADKCSRRKGYGRESAILMMIYGIKKLNVDHFTVKIGCDNEPSLKLFGNLGFVIESFSEVFQEYTMSLNSKTILDKYDQIVTYSETYFAH